MRTHVTVLALACSALPGCVSEVSEEATVSDDVAGQEFVGPTGSGALPALGAGLGAPSMPYNSGYQPSVQFYAMPNLPDIAAATIDSYGNPIIIYNPNVVAQTDPLVVQFFIAHEFGHVQLGHVYSPTYDAQTRIYREAEADCFAAQVLAGSNPAALQAAYQFFYYAQGPSSPDAVHPTGYQRANTIAACAGWTTGF